MLEAYELPHLIAGMKYGVRVEGHDQPLALFAMLGQATDFCAEANSKLPFRVAVPA